MRSPVPAPGATATDLGSRVRARTVTYGFVAVLLGATLLHVEAWPVTSFRLFSGVRTGEVLALEAVAVDADGDDHRILLGSSSRQVGNPAHQLRQTWHGPPEERRERMVAWLRAAGRDPADFVRIRIDEVRWRLDSDGVRDEELRRTTVVEVEL